MIIAIQHYYNFDNRERAHRGNCLEQWRQFFHFFNPWPVTRVRWRCSVEGVRSYLCKRCWRRRKSWGSRCMWHQQWTRRGYRHYHVLRRCSLEGKGRRRNLSLDPVHSRLTQYTGEKRGCVCKMWDCTMSGYLEDVKVCSKIRMAITRSLIVIEIKKSLS